MPDKLKLNWWPESCDLPQTNDSGTQISKLTSAQLLTNNIYCEQPYCSADGNHLALWRMSDPDPTVPGDLMVYDISGYRISKVQKNVFAIANAAWSGVLFVTVGAGADKRLMRIDINTLESEELFGWNDIPVAGLQTVSADGRYGLGSKQLERQRFGVFRIDLQTGQSELIHEGPYLCNTHLQYRLHTASRILVQENRGCEFAEDGTRIRACDERGTTLYTIAADGSDQKYFPVGAPFTPGTTGHECWIGDTDHALVTVSAPAGYDGKQGTVLEVRGEWEQPRVVFETPYVWNHISVTRCGRYFVTDSYQVPDVPILLGSIQSGKTRVLCHSKTSGGGAQYTHAHPYVTSDNKYVVFNSDRTGIAQVYIASIPEGFLESLD